VIKLKIGIWGSSGFAGAELIKLFSKRKELDICRCKISKDEGCKSEDATGDIEVAFLALPASQSMKLVPKLLDQQIKVIDLSGAYRLKTAVDYQGWYGFKHTYPSLLEKAVYGLPEKNRQMIRDSKFIANPGCYATAVSLGLLPLVENRIIDVGAKIVVEAVSGYTGGGKDVKIPDVVTAYKGGRQHQHIPEIEQELSIN
jgi:N-acetyl-gamma-glutamyl-phosphate reductase